MARLALYKGEVCEVIEPSVEYLNECPSYRGGFFAEYTKGWCHCERLNSRFELNRLDKTKRYWWVRSYEYTELPDCPLTWAIYG